MNHSTFISIVMPIYNREWTAKNAIDSILNQTYTHFELIIVDDASTDSTVQVVSGITDDRIRFFTLRENKGAAAARNIGIKHARGNWIAFQDSDDYWLPEKLEKQVFHAQKSKGCNGIQPVIYTGFNRYKDNKEEYIPFNDGRNKEGFIHRELLLGNFITTQTVMIPTRYFEEVGYFDESMPRLQDWELWIRLSLKYPFSFINEPLVNVYYTEGSISSNQAKMVMAYELILERHGETFRAAGPKYISSFTFSLGHNLCLIGKMNKGRKMLFQSYKCYPKSLKYLLALCTSFLGKHVYKLVYKLYNR